MRRNLEQPRPAHRRKHITVRRVIDVVGSIHSIDLVGAKPLQSLHIDRARSIAMYVARYNTYESYRDLAKAFRTAPGSVLTKVLRISELLRDDVPLRAHIRAIESVLERE
jgi:chromosomal replication initiation ATPase DnaA